MATITMRRIRDGEVPFDGGTAIQQDPDLPVFHGNGADDYVCVVCGTVLAAAMHAELMTKKVRVRCARCNTVNVAVTDDSEPSPPAATTVSSPGGDSARPDTGASSP